MKSIETCLHPINIETLFNSLRKENVEKMKGNA